MRSPRGRSRFVSETRPLVPIFQVPIFKFRFSSSGFQVPGFKFSSSDWVSSSDQVILRVAKYRSGSPSSR